MDRSRLWRHFLCISGGARPSRLGFNKIFYTVYVADSPMIAPSSSWTGKWRIRRENQRVHVRHKRRNVTLRITNIVICVYSTQKVLSRYSTSRFHSEREVHTGSLQGCDVHVNNYLEIKLMQALLNVRSVPRIYVIDGACLGHCINNKDHYI